MSVSGLIVIGGSAGSVSSLVSVMSGLPADLPAAVLVAIHIAADADSSLPAILERSGPLAARHVSGPEPLRPSVVFVAPPDRHLLVDRDTVRPSRGPRENRHRPSIDTLFRSAAQAYGDRVVAVVLSGALWDGSVGAQVVAAAGGHTIVQDPDEAQFPGMPLAAQGVAGSESLRLTAIGPRVAEIARGWRRLNGTEVRTEMRDPETDGRAAPETPEAVGLPSVGAAGGTTFGCPECGGVLQERPDGTGYLCRVGHGYAHDDLANAQRDAVEAALWSALRGFDERRELNERLARRAGREGRAETAAAFAARAEEAHEHGLVIRRLLLDGDGFAA